MDQPDMPASEVIAIVQLLNQSDIRVCVDGGWGVDALLGEQTRPHSDLDIAVQHKDVPQVRALLAGRGYQDVPRDDSWECNFVLGNARGYQVDIHSYTFDAQGRLVYGVAYPFDSLNGSGSIAGEFVKCITPEWLVKFHTGYPLDKVDYQDVRRLCQRFGIKIPDEYQAFVENEG